MYIGHDVAGESGRAAIVRPAGEGPGPRRRTGSTSAAWWTGRVGSTGVGARGLFPCDLATGKFRPTPGGIERPRRRDARTQLPSHQPLA